MEELTIWSAVAARRPTTAAAVAAERGAGVEGDGSSGFGALGYMLPRSSERGGDARRPIGLLAIKLFFNGGHAYYKEDP
jgi:hypothetical protein